MALPEHRADREYQKFVLDPDGNVAVRYQSSQVPQVLSNNSTNTILAADASYTGTFTDVSDFPSILISCLSNTNGTLFIDFSYDGTTVDVETTHPITKGVNFVKVVPVSRQYFRVRFVNSGTDQTSFNLTAIIGTQQEPLSNIESLISYQTDVLQEIMNEQTRLLVKINNHIEIQIKYLNEFFVGGILDDHLDDRGF